MKKSAFIIPLLFTAVQCLSQDLVLLNPNQSLVHFNPSYAGSNGGVRNQFSYISDWYNGRVYNHAVVNSFDIYVKPLKAGLGLTYIGEDYAVFKKQEVRFTYAQHLNLLEEKVKIIPSVNFGYNQSKLDHVSIWVVPGSSDPLVTERQYFDLNGGFVLNYKRNLSVGGYAFHINRPNAGIPSSYNLRPRILLHASYNLDISEKSKLQFFYRSEAQSYFEFMQLAANLVLKEHFITGVGYSTYETAFINLGYKGHYMSFLASYNLMFSRLSAGTHSGLELHASYNLRNKENRKLLTNFETW